MRWLLVLTLVVSVSGPSVDPLVGRGPKAKAEFNRAIGHAGCMLSGASQSLRSSLAPAQSYWWFHSAGKQSQFGPDIVERCRDAALHLFRQTLQSQSVRLQE